MRPYIAPFDTGHATVPELESEVGAAIVHVACFLLGLPVDHPLRHQAGPILEGLHHLSHQTRVANDTFKIGLPE